MGSVLAGAGVNPPDQCWGFLAAAATVFPAAAMDPEDLSLSCSCFLCNWFDCCATKDFLGIAHGQASDALTQVFAAMNYFSS